MVAPHSHPTDVVIYSGVVFYMFLLAVCLVRALPQVGNLTEVFIPFVKYRIRLRAERRAAVAGTDEKEEEGTQAEMGLYLEQYDREYNAYLDLTLFTTASFSFASKVEVICPKNVCNSSQPVFYSKHLSYTNSKYYVPKNMGAVSFKTVIW